MKSVMGIYARETGQGMIFSHDTDAASSDPTVETSAEVETPRKRAHLTVVK